MGKEMTMEINMEMTEGKKKRGSTLYSSCQMLFSPRKHTSRSTTSHREDPGQQRPSCGHKLQKVAEKGVEADDAAACGVAGSLGRA
jgi:hypothetical protein